LFSQGNIMEPARDVTRWASSPGERPTAWLAAAAGGGAVALGLAVAGCWLSGHPRAAAFGTGPAYMKLNAAIAFIISGLALLLNSQARPNRLGPFLAALAGTLGLFSALETVLHVNLGIDLVLMSDPYTTQANFPGRMSIITACGFALFGIGSLAGFSTTGAFALTDGQALTVTGAVAGSQIGLTVTGALAVNGTINGGTVALSPTGAITEGTGGLVTATTLTRAT